MLSFPLSAIELEKFLPEEYNLGISSFTGKDLGGDELFLLQNLPSQVLSFLGSIPDHHFSPEETEAMKDLIYRKAAKTLEEELGLLIMERDDLFFSPGSRQRRITLDEKIDLKRKEIENLKIADLDDLKVQEIVPVRLAEENLKGELLPPVGYYPGEYCEKQNLDFLIYGTLERVEEYYYLELLGYNRFYDDIVFRESLACTARELTAETMVLVKKIASTILGRPWASLRVTVDPPGSSIRLNGIFIGLGAVNRPWFIPGEYTVECTAVGYETKTVEVIVEAEDEKDLAVALEEGEKTTFRLESRPPGADVYISSQWVGKTPLDVAWSESPVQLTLLKEGYRRFVSILAEAPEEELSISLQPEPGVKYNSREDFRDRFYRDFSVFVLSVPLTLAGYSMAEHYSFALNDALDDPVVPQEEIYRLWRRSRVCYTLYTAGLFANTFLFANLIVSTAEYLARTGSAVEGSR